MDKEILINQKDHIIMISLQEYKELLIIKGRYEEIKNNNIKNKELIVRKGYDRK